MKNIFLLFFFIPCFAYAERFVVFTKKRVDLPHHLKIESLFGQKDHILKNYFVVSGNINEEDLLKLPGVISVEKTFELESRSLSPGKRIHQEIADELFNYQWGLFNFGQIFFKEKDDISNEKIFGKDSFDLGVVSEILKSEYTNEKIIVAVLDSGIDLNHFEFRNHLWKNLKECSGDPHSDNDGNLLKGDCHGWNFTEPIDSENAKSPQDTDGHGTHVAGIIAAAKNGKGIVGVSDNVLIMPIKVLKDTNSTSQISSSEAFARGIIYAVDNGAKIINMSLGWPRSLETKFLRDAVQYALSKNVLIVAAAGNNNSTEPLFPCSYEGVICVASSSLNGEFASFSNFGGHVDTIAPGEGILSLHPEILEPDLFSIPGFEIRSGTSQSAPFVSGLIARVLGKEPLLNVDNILGRIYFSEKFSSKNKFIQGGAATYKNFSTPLDRPMIVPVFKRVRQILVQNQSAKIIIPVKNYGLQSSFVDLELVFSNKDIIVKNALQKLPPLDTGKGVELEFDIEFNHLEMDHVLEMMVKISSHGGILTYKNQVPALIDPRSLEDVGILPFEFQNKTIPLNGNRNGEIVTFLNTLESLGEKKDHEFYLRRFLKKDSLQELELTLFRRGKNLIRELSKKIIFANTLNIVNFKKVDLNFDGQNDYFFQLLCEKDEKKFFRFVYLNSDLENLWEGFPHFDFFVDSFLESMNEIFFIKFTDPILGKMRVPAFFTLGQLPQKDQFLNLWEKPQKDKKKRFYFLKRDGVKFILNTPTNLMWEQSLREKKRLSWKDSIEVESLLPVSDEDFNQGQVKLLISTGNGTKRKWFKAIFSEVEKELGHPLSPLVFQTEEVKNLMDLGSNQFRSVGEAYFNIYDKNRSKLILSSDIHSLKQIYYDLDSAEDVLLGQLGSYLNQENVVSFLESKENLIWFVDGDSKNVFRRKKIRYSFLSQKMLSEFYVPLTIKKQEKLSPALYVDLSSITGNRISIMDVKDEIFSARLKHSYFLPPNCKTLNPFFNQESVQHEIIFVCQENQNWNLKILPIRD